MNTESQKINVAKTFLNGLSSRDGDLLRSIMSYEVVWRLPGNSLISGEAHGIEAVINRARMIVDYGMNFELEHIQLGWNGVAVSLHNTARREDNVFDQHLVTVLSMCEGKVYAINTFMSDVVMVNRFFVPV